MEGEKNDFSPQEGWLRDINIHEIVLFLAP
jgi:hypothetical protein